MAAEQAGGRGEVSSTADVLDSWKDIASYLQRDVRTVMRWERTRRLPIHRLPGGKKAAVFALKSELEAWRAAASALDDERHDDAPAGTATDQEPAAPPIRQPGRLRASRLLVALLALSAVPLAVAAILLFQSARRATPTAAAPIRSLVVLPFDNLNKDPQQDYLADGVHDALITELARGASASGLQVRSRASAMRYRGKATALADIARELQVDAVVEGSVLRAGDRVLVNVQLIRTANDDHLWANRYERAAADVLGLVTELSQAIRSEVQLAVAEEPAAVARAASRPVRPDVVDAYLRGRYAYLSLSSEGLETAARLYRQALDDDPAFAPAWIGLALATTAQAFISNASPDVLPKARDAAQRALALDPTLTEASSIISYVALYWDWDFAGAGKALGEAIRVDPDSPMVRHAYADYLMVTGDAAGSLEQVRGMFRLDPAFWPARGIFLYHAHAARHYDEVIKEGRELARLFPGRRELHYRVGLALWLLARRDEAVDEWAQFLGPAGASTVSEMRQALRRGDANAVLSRLADVFASRARQGQQGAFAPASLYAAAGDAANAFRWLDQGYARREPGLLHIVADPLFDPIRPDPRFDALLRRIGIPRQ